ncbi:response regulator [Terasakiella sp. A23]|uniref:response regulator n=1 Tax=Terasakiella sp. FCG-A23 TaxID=3080561 RepID=UPI002955B26C|nr:response regulator [Terasakiella sp. A23]MDV7338938.1 response regulator [Terasakiella sp. A23]
MTSSAIRLLIADDDAGARDQLSHQLDGQGFALDIHDSGEGALKALNDNSREYDVILLDLSKPDGMSGLDCLRTIKAADKFRHLPVILQTSDNDTNIITEALASGAYYFLEKSTEQKLLQAVVQSAMEYKLRFQEIEKERQSLKSGLRFVERATFRIRTLSEMNLLTGLLATAYPDPDRVTVGIHELLTNAIEHGNLGITYDGKSQLIMEDKWKSEIDFRLALPENQNKTVEIELVQSADKIVMTIIDQGDGFDCENYMEIDPCRLFDPHGRGIAVAKSMSFDDLIYIGKGNQVVATVKL